MTAMIIMVVWDTPENKRDEYTERSLASLIETVDFHKHRLFISDNGSHEPTQIIYEKLRQAFQNLCFPKDHLIIHQNGSNIGCSNAINQGLRVRKLNEACIKLDGDVVFYERGWVERLIGVIERCPEYGIVGGKRKDLDNHPDQTQEDHNNDIFKTELRMLPHKKGQRHIVVEECPDIIGTVTLFNPKLIDAIGMSWQPKNYGFEDSLYSLRSRLAGFKNCFEPTFELDHIDTGASEYTNKKQQWAHESWAEYEKAHHEFINGVRPLYYDGGFDD